MELKNYAHFFCTVVIERLIEAGADHFFIASGSRSTPIVSAIVRNSKAKIFLGLDERAVAFSALGYGKRANKAGVIVVTSGTAASNLYPAITESFMSSVPMLVLTADRPFDLHDCGANQTVFQSRMFANHVVKNFDLAPPSSLASLESTVAIFEHALRYTHGAKKGPVHVNMQLREPVANLVHENEPAWSPTKLAKRKFTEHQPLSITPTKAIIDALTGKGIIVVGEILADCGQEQILALSERLGWPIFADISSNLRLCDHENVVAHYDIKMLNEEFLASLDDRVTVIKFGSRIVSKRWWHWVETRPAHVSLLSVDTTVDRIDQTGRFEHIFVGDLPTFLSSLLVELPKNNSSSSLINSRPIDHAISELLETSDSNEAYFAARLVAQIDESANLFLSSGMPIRDVDQFAHKKDLAVDVFVNRGASGIDGIMSTAAGIAFAQEKPTYVLIGDVAFLHDTNGLMHIKESKAPMLIVVINNGGGGIFHLLPIANEGDVISPYLDTPHHVRIDHLCRAHDVTHVPVRDARSFDEALKEFSRTKKSAVVEVHIDRDKNVSLHKSFYQKIAKLRLS